MAAGASGPVTVRVRVSGSVALFGMPVALSVRRPPSCHLDDDGRCIYGYWNKTDGRWEWGLQDAPDECDTHWVSAYAEALPETCFSPILP